ncbi:hypothetical protein BGZ94_010263 [Podila epigama]|nr:hypothetical protein BGZ94_010263 [Podila epigama]
MAHRYGGLVRDQLTCYKQLDSQECQKRFSDANHLARLLAGSLIQSGEHVLLVLKIELYGRSKAEDPHEQPLAFPTLRDYIVASVQHDGAQKILIGTDTWLGLVTSCILLHSGDVDIGPHNKNFVPNKASIV